MTGGMTADLGFKGTKRERGRGGKKLKIWKS